MKPAVESACKNLLGQKTSIMFLGKNAATICQDFLGSLKDSQIANCIDINCCKKNHGQCGDIYILETDQLDAKSRLQSIKKIYKANPKACLFLIDSRKEISELTEEVRPLLDPIKMGNAIQGVLNPKDKDFKEIVGCISSMENTKQKLYSLWEKLDRAIA